jgi:hypothetical protein
MALDKFNPQRMNDEHLLPATLLEMGDTLNFIETRKHTLRNEIRESKTNAGVGKVSALAGMAGGAGLLILSNPLGSLFIAGGAICYGVSVFGQWLQTGKLQIMPMSSKTQAERDIELANSTETGNAYDVAAIQGQRDSIRENAAYLSDREKVEYELLHFSPEGLLSAMNHVHPTQRWACYQFLIDAFLAGTIQSYFANPQALRDVLGNPQVYTSYLPEASKRFPEYGLQSVGAIEGEKARSTFQPAIGTNTRLNSVEVSAQVVQSIEVFDWNRLNTDYNDFPHLFLLGKSGSGKSYLSDRLVRFLDGFAVVITPKRMPKDFQGLQVIGLPYSYQAIHQALTALEDLMIEREAEMQRTGKTDFPPVNVILDELPVSSSGCKDEGLDLLKPLKAIIRAGRTSKIRLIILAQGAEVKALGIEGEGALRDSLTYIYLKGFVEKQAQDLKLDISQYTRPCIIDGQIADTSFLSQFEQKQPRSLTLASQPMQPTEAKPQAKKASADDLERMFNMPSAEHEAEESAIETNPLRDRVRVATGWTHEASIELAFKVVEYLEKRSTEGFKAHRIKGGLNYVAAIKAMKPEKFKDLLDKLTSKNLISFDPEKEEYTIAQTNQEDEGWEF